MDAGRNGNAGDWPMVAHDYANTRYSTLDQIRRTNVAGLKLAWRFATGIERGHEAAPIVVGGTMYVATPFPNRVHAFDLSKPGSAPKWTYDPGPDPASQGVACCDVVNRGVAYADGKIFFNVLDDRTVALDASTGRPLWSTMLGDISKGETMTMAPIVIRRHVLVGNSGGEFGVRGWLTALDVDTGVIAWRAYSTGPDSDVLIGDGFAPFYASERGMDLGVATWPPEKWKLGGGTVWGFLSYDPELDLLYYGTANPGPWNAEQRPGDNKWTATVFARAPDTGAAKWAYQVSPHDLYDYDGVNESVLVDVELGGKRRKVLVHPDRNGYLYVLDRSTGEVLSAEPFVRTTTVNSIDRATGRPQYAKEKEPHIGAVVHDICPAEPGGKDWQPSAFSNKTGFLYIPHNNLCAEIEGTQANYIAGTPYIGENVRMVIGNGGRGGAFAAWDIAHERKVWSIEEDFPVWSGAVATAGDVVFYGTMDGYFKAVDALTGAVLWSYKAESGIIGQPITYLGPDHEQYVAVFSGVGGWAGALVPAHLDPADPTAGTGFANAMKGLQQRTKPGGTLLVFALPGSSR
ncbi:MAG TPA: PQQ-dependent dehydrogenase, methanol/ethanol family [Polyangiaceae bacterium]|nr:PQQ-dependent dehydrogenase, methanol/ethanol family [Polyangiaceae bacterium]